MWTNTFSSSLNTYYYYRRCDHVLIIQKDGLIRMTTYRKGDGNLWDIKDDVCDDPEIRELLELVYYVYGNI